MPSNYGGTSSLGWSYTGEFEKTTSKEESFEKSFDQSIETYYEQGGDAAGFKAGIKITLGFHQSDSGSSSEAERVSRSFSFHGETAPGEAERITAWRKVSRMKSEIVGTGDYEHSIKIGKHWHGKWQGRTHSWDSFADFLRVIKGEAPTSYDLAEEFRRSRVPSRILRRLEAPLNLPYRQPLEFDHATSIDLRKVAI